LNASAQEAILPIYVTASNSNPNLTENKFLLQKNKFHHN